jgi:hypothetical protein
VGRREWGPVLDVFVEDAHALKGFDATSELPNGGGRNGLSDDRIDANALPGGVPEGAGSYRELSKAAS